MPDQIDKDDEKFNQMITKQYPTVDSFFKAERVAEGQDPIEQDDEKIDELLMLQSMSETDEPIYDSIEEKYEEQIVMKEISEMVANHLSNMDRESDTLKP